MKGAHLGELEEMILLTVALLRDNAFSVTIQNELKERSNRKVMLSSLHTILARLKAKGFVTSKKGVVTRIRGGRRKFSFKITTLGYRVLREKNDLRLSFWKEIF